MEEVEAVIQVLDANEEFVKLMSHRRSVWRRNVRAENVFHGRVSDELTDSF